MTGSGRWSVGDLVATLDDFNVPKAEQEDLLGLLGPLREDIVDVESPETGAPLPRGLPDCPGAALIRP
jgi:hemoglobin